jgi:hypothetical protein
VLEAAARGTLAITSLAEESRPAGVDPRRPALTSGAPNPGGVSQRGDPSRHLTERADRYRQAGRHSVFSQRDVVASPQPLKLGVRERPGPVDRLAPARQNLRRTACPPIGNRTRVSGRAVDRAGLGWATISGPRRALRRPGRPRQAPVARAVRQCGPLAGKPTPCPRAHDHHRRLGSRGRRLHAVVSWSRPSMSERPGSSRRRLGPRPRLTRTRAASIAKARAKSEILPSVR